MLSLFLLADFLYIHRSSVSFHVPEKKRKDKLYKKLNTVQLKRKDLMHIIQNVYIKVDKGKSDKLILCIHRRCLTRSSKISHLRSIPRRVQRSQ